MTQGTSVEQHPTAKRSVPLRLVPLYLTRMVMAGWG